MMKAAEIPVAFGAMVQVFFQAIIALPLFPELIIFCVRNSGNFMLLLQMPGHVPQADFPLPLPEGSPTTMPANRLITPHFEIPRMKFAERIRAVIFGPSAHPVNYEKFPMDILLTWNLELGTFQGR